MAFPHAANIYPASKLYGRIPSYGYAYYNKNSSKDQVLSGGIPVVKIPKNTERKANTSKDPAKNVATADPKGKADDFETEETAIEPPEEEVDDSDTKYTATEDVKEKVEGCQTETTAIEPPKGEGNGSDTKNTASEDVKGKANTDVSDANNLIVEASDDKGKPGATSPGTSLLQRLWSGKGIQDSKGEGDEYDTKNTTTEDVKGKANADGSDANNLTIEASDEKGKPGATSPGTSLLQRLWSGKGIQDPKVSPEARDVSPALGKEQVAASVQAEPVQAMPPKSLLFANTLRIRSGIIYDATNLNVRLYKSTQNSNRMFLADPTKPGLFLPCYRVRYHVRKSGMPTFVLQNGGRPDSPPLACAAFREVKYKTTECDITLDAFETCPPPETRKIKDVDRGQIAVMQRGINHGRRCCVVPTRKITTSWSFSYVDPSTNNWESFTWYPTKLVQEALNGGQLAYGTLIQDNSKEVIAKYEGLATNRVFSWVSKKDWSEKFSKSTT